MSVRDQIIAQANRWLGTPYVWGGESAAEGGVDCSGLIIATYRDAGVPLQGRPIASQLGLMGTSVPISQAQPGDVVYYDRPGSTDHVGLYIGNGKMINAPTVGSTVRVDNVGAFTSIRRILTGDEPDTNGPWTGLDPYGLDDLAEDVNPFSNWVQDGTNLGVKLLVTGVAAALVVAGAMRTVGSSSS